MTHREEWVDVVNADGRVVDVVARRVMREQRLPHRCCYLFVFNRAGDVFVHQRTLSKDVYPGYWDVTIGGVLAAGETFDAGARREASEELGLPIADLACVPMFPFHYTDSVTVVQAWVYQLRHDGPFRLQPEEIVEGHFVPTRDIDARMREAAFCPDGLAVWRRYQAWVAEALGSA
jgi:isopentenyldiphosphate isomerase